MDLNIFRPSTNPPNVYVKPKREQYIRNPVRQRIQHFKRFIENYRRHIVCFMVISGITIGVTLERCYRECSTSPVCLADVLQSFTAPMYHTWSDLFKNTCVQTTVCRLCPQESQRLQWLVSSCPAAQQPPSPSCFPTCSSLCVVTSSHGAERRSSTDTSPLMPPLISIVGWPWLPSSSQVGSKRKGGLQRW